MKQKAASRQRDLFDVDDCQTSPIPAQREQLGIHPVEAAAPVVDTHQLVWLAAALF